MTKLLVHELATQAPPLRDRLCAVLAGHGGMEAQQLLARAVFDERPKPRMVLTGQFSGGKSTLIKALTDRAVNPKIDADISTGEVTEYPWDGEVILVDTPGVQSGLRTHDELALEAIGNSDFILFVITVGLFDDASRDYLRYLANERQKFEQMIVVITQSAKMSAPEGVREQAVQDALGTANYVLPTLEVDSIYYLRSLDDEQNRDVLRSKSGIDVLRAKINQLSEERGELARLRQRFQLIRQLCDEGQELFARDPHERLGLSVLAGQRKVVTERRALIETQFLAAESRFKSDCLTDVVAFVDGAALLNEESDPENLVLAEKRLVGALNRHAAKFAQAVNVLTAQQFDTLAVQIGEIGDSNRVAELLRYAGAVAPRQTDNIDAPRTGAGSTSDTSSRQGAWAQDLGNWLKQARGTWGAGEGARASANSLGHKTVKDVGHFFGAKFEPWQAVKIADWIGKAAKFAGFALQAVVVVNGVFEDERAERRAEIERQRKHSAFVTEIMALADAVATDSRSQLSGIIDPPLNQVLAQIDHLRDEILKYDETRDANSRELSNIAEQADRMLALSHAPAIIDHQAG
jgi:hypothetical protein